MLGHGFYGLTEEEIAAVESQDVSFPVKERQL